MKTKIRVVEHNGLETVYDVQADPTEPYTGAPHGISAIGYYLYDTDGVKIIIHPQSVNRIEIYEGDTLIKILAEKTHKK